MYYCSPTLGMAFHCLDMIVKWGKKITVYIDLYFSKMFKHLSFRYFVCYDPYVFCFSVCLYCSKYNYNLQVEINPACFVLYYILFCFFTLEYRVQIAKVFIRKRHKTHTHKNIKNFLFHLRTNSLGLVFELKSTGVLIFHLLESRFENCTCKSKYTRFCFVCKHATHFYVRLQQCHVDQDIYYLLATKFYITPYQVKI